MKIIPSTININRVADWVNSYFDWFMFNTKTIDPLMMNRNNYLIKASYHKEEGRNGYVPPESGSSESQFLTLLGFLYMFKATRDLKWLDVSKKIADACLKIMYNNKSIPTTDFDEDYLFIPNWLFNADVVSFNGEKYYVDKKVTFANGVGTFTSDYTARKIFSARTLESTLLWDSPYSTIIGKGYPIASYTANDKNFTVTLEDATFNGDLLVVYSDMGGDTIVPGECFEAYPMWRKLKDEEVACAIDSLWWSYECWKLLYEFTGETKYYNLYQNELKVIEYVCSIPDANDYLGVARDTTNPFSISGSFQYNERTVAPTFSRDANSGCIVIDVPQGTGKIDIGKGGINEVISKDRYYKLKISTGVATKMNIIMTDSIEYNEDRRWYHQVKTSGNNTLDEFIMKQSDFIQDKYIYFDLELKMIEENVFHGDSSTVTLTKVFDDNNEAVRRVDFDKVVEGGWCQYLPIISATYDSLPLMIYRGGKGISIRIKDANGWLWYRLLNEHTSFTSEIYDFTGFILSNYQANTTGTPPTSLTAPVSQILFETVDSTSWIELKRIGDITKCQMPQGITLQSMIIEFDEPSAQKVKICYLRPVPVEGYSYVPWVAPFSLNTINNSISDWRGTPYVGYQCPWIWQEYNKPDGVTQVLDFIQKSQDAYEKITNTSLRFFTQVFVWDRWDSRNYGSINEFTWDGPDPNTSWGGYQYRALETVAKTLYNDSTLTVAKTIIEDFLNSLLTVWTNTNQQIPTGFNKDGSITQGQEPHDVALLLRAAIYAYESGVCNEALCLNVIDKCMNNLNYCYAKTSKLTDFNSLSTKGTWFAWDMWYGYWGGEIMRTLAVLMKFSKNELFVKTDSGIKLINTYPLWYDLENYISIKTPIGCQKMELIDITDSLSTQLRIKTSDSVKCLKGSNYALPTDFNNRAVFTFVDDDGSAAFLTNIKPEFDKRGLKCNLAIISGVVGSDTYLNLTQIKELENEGYEMLCHSDNLDSLVVDTADTHLANAINWFKNGIDYSDCLVYPNGNTGDTKSQIQTIAGNHFKYALNVTGGNMVKPYIYLDLSRIYISKTTGLNSWVKSVIDECLSTNGWIVFYTHSWMRDGSDGEFSKKSLQDILDYILDNSGKILTFKQALQGKA